jgi:hypothetical protein
MAIRGIWSIFFREAATNAGAALYGNHVMGNEGAQQSFRLIAAGQRQRQSFNAAS